MRSAVRWCRWSVWREVVADYEAKAKEPIPLRNRKERRDLVRLARRKGNR